MLTIITLAAIVFLLIHWEHVLALFAWIFVAAACLVGFGVFMVAVTLFWFGVAKVIQ